MGQSEQLELIAPFEKGLNFFICHRASRFMKLLWRHAYDTPQRSEFWNLFGGRLHNFGDDVTVAFNRHALAFLDRSQELRQLVLRFCNAHRHTHIVATH